MKTLEEILQYTNETETGCLEWTRCFNTDGYARMAWKGSTNGKVHRIVYELTNDEDIEGKVIRHTCDNPRCINPKHLISGSYLDNVKDRNERERTYKKINKEVISKVKALLETKLFSNKEIAKIVGIDSRRVSDIDTGKYTDEGKLTRYLPGGL